ncbi:MAG TPA: hypothetical protein VIV65_02975 [Gemmatimonadaceae bacterium]
MFAGSIAAAATTGALIGLGRRDATAARVFNVIGAHVLGSAGVSSFHFGPGTVAGILFHLVFTITLGVLILYLTTQRRLPLWPTAFGLAVLSALVSIGLARRSLPSLGLILPIGDLVAYYVVLAVSLGVGIRFAFPRQRILEKKM